MRLFLSFSGLLHAIAHDEVSQADLDTGLFFFGCTRSHALNPGGAGEFDERTKDEGGASHEKLVRALERAELENRCRWHKPRAHFPPYSLLNELLCANGFPQLTLPPDIEELGEVEGYAYPAVARMVEAAGSPVEVHF
jgi:hypothetical protein